MEMIELLIFFKSLVKESKEDKEEILFLIKAMSLKPLSIGETELKILLSEAIVFSDEKFRERN
jgi:hypothetical protein